MTYVHELMSKNVITIDDDKTAYDAAKIMAEKDIGTLVIVKDEKPIGIVTERDLVKRICAKDLKASEVIIKDIMSKPLVTIQPNMPIELAATLMAENRIRRLPVVKDEKLVGIITTADIIKDLEGWIESP
ncbi:MAG: hypothetical protein KatS3mg003_2377 [Candidatus Nitrosocaldaceae archaeon]|nr:MAG: hypothetical protein KatS3mg003_2377 [Candidatus Nitrosocaldaceae archaeon]